MTPYHMTFDSVSNQFRPLRGIQLLLNQLHKNSQRLPWPFAPSQPCKK